MCTTYQYQDVCFEYLSNTVHKEFSGCQIPLHFLITQAKASDRASLKIIILNEKS
jgi:hypothetical protein